MLCSKQIQAVHVLSSCFISRFAQMLEGKGRRKKLMQQWPHRHEGHHGNHHEDP